jgi:anaerobic selenocysteine-containing dehydrogenase
MTNGWVDIKNADVVLVMGGNPAENRLIRYALRTGRYHEEYVRIHTAGPYIVGDKYDFNDGLFSGFEEGRAQYDKSSWAYQPDPKTNAYRLDPTMKDPRCTLQLLKTHVERYTPEMVERICGTPVESFLKVAELVTSTGVADRVGTITYAVGWTQHSVGVQMIRAAATLQLLYRRPTPSGSMDPNTWTPEFKTFLVRLEKAEEGVS